MLKKLLTFLVILPLAAPLNCAENEFSELTAQVFFVKGAVTMESGICRILLNPDGTAKMKLDYANKRYTLYMNCDNIFNDGFEN